MLSAAVAGGVFASPPPASILAAIMTLHQAGILGFFLLFPEEQIANIYCYNIYINIQAATCHSLIFPRIVCRPPHR